MISSHTRTRILGTGHFLPEPVRTNADLERMVDTSDSWITERTGIRERRIAPDGMNTSDMAAEAAKRALDAASVNINELDMILVATVTPDCPMPANAVFVQQKIGAPMCPAFDLSAACAGFIFGLSMADALIRVGQCRRILLIGVELLSRVLNWGDRTTCVLFGDGAGAVLLGPSEPSVNESERGLLAIDLATDGSMADALIIPAGGSACPITHALLDEKRNKVSMRGQDIFKVAVKNLIATSRKTLAQAEMTSESIDWVCAHQANTRILDQVSSRLQIPQEKMLTNIARVGNTSSASIPILLDENVRSGKIRPNQTVLMCALGAGISWGSAVVRM